MSTLVNAGGAPIPSVKFVVILTATIGPRGNTGKGLVRADPAQRRADYEVALRFWLGLDAPWLAGVVFAENSASPLDSLERVAREENPKRVPVELISFDSPPPPEGLHYGYSELVLLRDAVSQSQLARTTAYFVKATGRYRFPQIGRLIQRLPSNFLVAVDCKRGKRFSRDRHLLTHFALAIFSTEFFREFIAPIPEKMVPAPPWTRAQFVETMIFDELVGHRAKAGVILRWPCNCEPIGIGANGDDYNSPRRRAQAGLRSLGRKLFPWIWL